MKKNTTHIEQLYQELLSQDPSLVSQKSKIIWLLERMTEHTPSVSIDPLFQKNLKSRLEHHIQYIHNLKANPPQVNPRINRLARLISYGLPAVAIGVIIFLALPYNPTTAPIETTPNEYNSLLQEQSDSLPITTTIEDKPTIIQTKSQIPQQTEKIIPQDISVKQEETHTSEPMMLKTISTPSTPEWWESTTNDTMMIQEDIPSSQKSTPLSPTSQQIIYTNNTLTLNYNLYRSWEDLLLQGTLDYCKQNYTITEPLVWVSNTSTIVAQIKDTSSDTTPRISLYFTDGLITDVQWLSQCK